MKTVFAALLLAGAFAASSASAATICLKTRDIVSTSSKDGKVLDFVMRDGRKLHNHLQGVCSDLKFEGFEWTIRGAQEVCENQQSLRVLRSGQTCVLGKFDPPEAAMSKTPDHPG